MRSRRLILGSIVAFVVGTPLPAQAAHHLWRVQQLFSNASGTVQFVELETTSSGRTGETNVSGFMLTAGGNTFTFSTNVTPGSSGATQWLLLATSNVASLPGGVTPDFVIPANFFSTGGGTINYASGTDTWSYGTVPTDGVHALARDPDTQAVTTAVNQPINLAGATGQLSVAATAAPALASWALAVAVGALLLVGSGLLRRPGARVA